MTLQRRAETSPDSSMGPINTQNTSNIVAAHHFQKGSANDQEGALVKDLRVEPRRPVQLIKNCLARMIGPATICGKNVTK